MAPSLPSPNQIIEFTAQEGITGIILLTAGILFLFFGLKLFRPTLFLSGFFAGFYLSPLAISHLPAGTIIPGTTVDLIVKLIAGLFAGIFTMTFWKVGVVMIGGLAGYCLSMWVLVWEPAGVVTDQLGQSAVIIICIVLGVISAYFAEKHFVIVGTSVSGAYSIVVGVDQFSDFNLGNLLLGFTRDNHEHSDKTYILFGAYILVVLVGIFVQYRITGNGLKSFSRKN